MSIEQGLLGAGFTVRSPVVVIPPPVEAWSVSGARHAYLIDDHQVHKAGAFADEIVTDGNQGSSHRIEGGDALRPGLGRRFTIDIDGLQTAQRSIDKAALQLFSLR